MSEYQLETKHLKKYFKTGSGLLHAVDDVNIAIRPGRTLGVVGESGCGKSTLGRVVLRLLEATEGEIYYNGEDIRKYSANQMKQLRTKMQLIFQDPYSSLNPRLTISEIIAEPIKVCGILKHKDEINDRVHELMRTVGIAERLYHAYPHELDGGRRQRVGIARALSVSPEFIVCDEPVSSLDVAIQAQVLNLLMDLQEEKKLTYMFITHDLSVVKHISTEIAVMYLGQCVERAKTDDLFDDPKHPYTKALLQAIPTTDIYRKIDSSALIKGEVTSPINPKPGCRFAARCKYATERCKEPVELKDLGGEHFVACHLYDA